MGVARWVAERLEAGRPLVPAPIAEPLARAWDAVARRAVVRTLDLRPFGTLPVVAVGGATLGGSGKTPVALACARALARGGAAVAIVGHAYRAHPGADGRLVASDDSVDVVGDEALALTREITRDGATARIAVVVGRSRASALAFAARSADVVVLDGVLQTAPKRAALAILAVDAARPWGGDAAPPRGDRRAPRDALLAACDLVVAVGHPPAGAFAPHVDRPARTARVRSHGVVVGGQTLPWADVSAQSVGLYTALARPDRVLRFLAERGVVPVAHIAVGDHARPMEIHKLLARDAVKARGVTLWLVSSKCATRLPSSLGGAPVAVVDYALELDAQVVERLAALVARRRPFALV